MNYDTTIFRECTIRLSKDTATIDEPVYVFKGDRNIKLKFNLQGLKYKFSEHPLDIYFETQQAAFCQVKWYRADDVKITFDIQSCDGGMPVLVIGEELMDEDVELGNYSIQIRLLDYNKNSILTLPLIENAVTIKAPVFEGGETQAYIAKADEGAADKAKISVLGVAQDVYGVDGKYNKKEWTTGDVITSAELNKSEQAIYDLVDTVDQLVTTGGVKGDKGDKGDPGNDGQDGETPNITIGTVTTLNPTDTATAEITGSTPNLTLNLGIPKGANGADGADGRAPTITIGTVTSGTTASATISGSAPNYTLNLVLPKGADGQAGANGQDGANGVDGKDGLTTKITINGTTYTQTDGEITLPAYPIVPTKLSELTNDKDFVTDNTLTARGYATTADIPTKLSELTDDVGHITLDDIPKATNNTAGLVKVDGTTLDTDADGTLKYIGTVADTPTLTVGTVTKGDNAAASISGTAPNYTLDLTLPKGDAGAKGDNGDTVAVSVNGSTYSHINGTITLPNYPTPRTDDEIKSLADGQISENQKNQLKDYYVKLASNTDMSDFGIDDLSTLTSLLDLTKVLGYHVRFTIQVNAGASSTLFNSNVIPVDKAGLLILTCEYARGSATYHTYDNIVYASSTDNSTTIDWRAWVKLIDDSNLTTTINSSSTDTQVPSAKSVYDNIKTKNTMQPAGTIANYSTVLDWAVANIGATCTYEGNNFTDCPLKGEWGTLVCIGTKVENGLKVLACRNHNSDILVRTIRRSKGVIEWVEPTWKRLCTTTVADVGETAITTLNSYVTSGKIYYQVKNGVCYVSIIGLVISTDAATNFILCSGLPKCASKPHHIITDGSANVTSGFLGLVYLLANGELGINLNRAGTGYCSFSYPVAES